MSSTIKARVESDLKLQAETVFRQLGMDMSSAIKMFLAQVVQHQALPFEVKLVQPNARTLLAVADSYAGRIESVDSVDALFADADP